MLKKMISFVAVAGLVLALAGSVQAAQYTWNGGAGATWDTTGTNWVGVPVNPWNAANGPSNDALFDTASATATVSGTIYTNGITFSTNTGTTISDGTINLAGASPFIRFDNDRRNATINSVIDGTNGLTFSQLDNRNDSQRRLTLNGVNTYSGVTTIDGIPRDYFRLRAGNSQAFGPASTASIAFGPKTGQERQILELYGNDITVIGLNYPGGNDGGPPAFGAFVYNTHSTTDATLTVNTSVDSSFGGAFRDEGGGALGLIKDGAARLSIFGGNRFHAYSGGLTIKNGTLRVDGNSNGVMGTAGITMGDTGTTGTLEFNQGGSGTTTNSQAVTLATGGTGAFQINTAAITLRLSGIVSGAGDLTKTGAGRLRLSNLSNAYTGDTSVLAGIFEINGPFLDDGSGVYLTTGATMDLDFVGTDTIGGLFFDAAPQDLGTWGRIGSGADNESDFFTSDGLLNVIPEPASAVLLLLGLPFVMRRKRR